MMIYLFRYEHWIQGSLGKMLRHIGISGSMAALACALLVPVSHRFGQQLRAAFSTPFRLNWSAVPSSVLAATAGLWIFGVAVYVF